MNYPYINIYSIFPLITSIFYTLLGFKKRPEYFVCRLYSMHDNTILHYILRKSIKGTNPAPHYPPLSTFVPGCTFLPAGAWHIPVVSSSPTGGALEYQLLLTTWYRLAYYRLEEQLRCNSLNQAVCYFNLYNQFLLRRNMRPFTTRPRFMHIFGYTNRKILQSTLGQFSSQHHQGPHSAARPAIRVAP